MFCANCGAPLKEGAKFCSKCGTPVQKKKTPEDIPAAPSTTELAVRTKVSKRIPTVKWLCVILLACVIVFGVSRVMRFSNTPCDWCGTTPTLSYKLQNGDYAHICKNCRSYCMICGEPATKHYENLLGTMVFFCNDCYQELQELSEGLS